MYALAWIFVRSPIVVSFSTREPRPMTTSSPTTQRSRTHAWSPTTTRAPIRQPSPTTVPGYTTAVGATSASGKRLLQRVLELLQGADDERARPRGLVPRAASLHTREEVLALEPQRLVVRDLRRVDVARAR